MTQTPSVESLSPEDRAEAILDAIIASKGGSRRNGQIAMARAVAKNLSEKVPFIVEGGTGVGKSIAYICGALATGKSTVIAPHTKQQQDQLIEDIEFIVDVLSNPEHAGLLTGHAPQYAVLKGKSSYLCKAKLSPSATPEDSELAIEGLAESTPSDQGKQVLELREWAETTDTGDRADAPFPVTSLIWKAVSSTTEECTGKGCPLFDECFAVQARRDAQLADFLIVNQAYLATALKLGPDANILPPFDQVIIDEAHEFASVVSNAFSVSLTADTITAAFQFGASQIKRGGETDEITKLTDRGGKAANALGAALDATLAARSNSERFAAPSPEEVQSPVVVDALTEVSSSAKAFLDAARYLPVGTEEDKAKADLYKRRFQNLIEDIAAIRTYDPDTETVWIERGFKARATLRAARFDVASTVFNELVKQYRAVVFTSATMTVGGTFDAPARDLGLIAGPWRAEQVESPFDYEHQGLVWYPTQMPDPADRSPQGQRAWLKALTEVIVKTALSAGGRTMVLCTSWKTVDDVAPLVEQQLPPDFNVIPQERGVAAKSTVEAFRSATKGVLIGTRGIMAGTNIAGDDCIAVIIDKMPFPSPADPVIHALSEKADRRRAENPRENKGGFAEVSLAKACVTLTQAAGRLIRTVTDHGVVVLPDPRLNILGGPFKKGYSRQARQSIPPFPPTDDEVKVTSFLESLNAQGLSAESVSEDAATEEVGQPVGNTPVDVDTDPFARM